MAKNRLGRLLAKDTGQAPCVQTGSSRAEMEARERRWQAEDALRTLTRAQEIQRNRGLMKDVKTVAREQLKQLQTVAKPSGRR